jgi:hypothetical protein
VYASSPEDLRAQVLPRLGIPKEARYVDQNRVEQRGELLGVHLQILEILRVVGGAHLGHSMVHPAGQAGAFVAGEVKTAVFFQMQQQCLE